MKAEDRALGATHSWEGEEQEDRGPGGNQSSQDVGERTLFSLLPHCRGPLLPLTSVSRTTGG